MFQGAIPEWRPDPAAFLRYGVDEGDYPWFLRGEDPVFFRLARDAEKPIDRRPLLVCVSLYLDKFRRGELHAFLVSIKISKKF